MQLLKQKIKFIPNVDRKIEISFTDSVNFVGLQENINNFVTEEIGISINDVIDAETFRYLPISATTLTLYFYSGNTYDDSYEFAGFTTGETLLNDVVVLRSFYIIQIYDSTTSEKQTLLNSGYFNGYNFIKLNSTGTTYVYDQEEEFTNLYVPQWFIESLSGQTTTIYGKISFYNAKTGKLQLFSISNSNPTIDSDLYFPISLNPSGFTYTINPIIAYEIKNTTYINKINNTITSFDNKKPSYPTGNTFINTGKYID